MLQINQNYTKLPGSYLFADISRKINQYQQDHPEKPLIRLGIGDVTRPLAPRIISQLHQAVDEQASGETFKGYGPEQGYAFLREKIATDYHKRCQVSLKADEIFVSDGSKCDTGNFSELFADDAKVAVCDPVYPVYVDSNAMAGRAGDYDHKTGRWSNLIYLPCLEENGFLPQVPGAGEPVPDLIYLCFPNNPTGAMASRELLSQWVEYATEHKSLILYDAAYTAFIREDLPLSIFEIEGARNCAVEFCSFSKLAGFTGLRLGYAVIPDELVIQGTPLNQLWSRRQTTKFNGACCLAQSAGAAVFSPEGEKQIQESIHYYQKNADLMTDALRAIGFKLSGGVNAPYIWLQTPDKMTSWDFFDLLLNKAGVVGTPGSGFGPCGEGYFRLTAFGTHDHTRQAMARIKDAFV